MISVFKAAETPLTRGTTLIEASAGTGKTYTITAIFLRLLLECGLDVSQILVTTYTEAATGELRDRIRGRLTSALDGFQTGSSKDPLVADLIDRLDAEPAIRTVERALREFDRAAIFTIHGFCQRMLREHALESGLPFDAELITDQSAILQEIVDDFWRTEFGSAAAILGSLCTQSKLTRDKLVQLLGQVVNRPTMVLTPSQPGDALAQLKAELDQVHADLRQHWTADHASIRLSLTGPPKWAAARSGTVGHQPTLAAWLEAIVRCLGQESGAVEDFLVLGKLCSSRLNKACLKGYSAPAHPFFDACERFKQLCDRFTMVAKTSFLAWAVPELSKRKEQRNLLSFDDLLTRLHAALHGDGGSALANAVRSRFHAALVDEFQDTDPVQESIFREVFGLGTSYLYLIGDPKQAIYGFRGADIFSYLRAAASAQHRYTLRTNRRSASRLVAAVNHLFTRSKAPFVFSDIDFIDVDAAGDRDSEPLVTNGAPSAPLKIWTYDSEEPVSSTEANRELPSLTANAISRVLSAGARIGSRPVKPSDIAVLVAQHWQARAVQDGLRDLNVPSVLLSDESVWHTEDAFELHVLLAAIAEPTREDRVRAAFATEMMGGSLSSLDGLISSESKWQEALLRFSRYHDRWMSFGFIQMFRTLLLGEHIRPRLLKLPDGDRRLTNVMHIAELLHRESVERQLAPSALLRWLELQRASSGVTAEDAILRLERDDDAVQVITMHRSKGLEFPIVFCPFAWGKPANNSKDAPIVFHDPENHHRLTMDLGSDDAEVHAQMLARERLAEEARLLYVALTRAIHGCHFVWGRFSSCPVSAAALILHEPPGSGDIVAGLRSHMENLTAEQFTADLHELESTANGNIAVAPLTAESGIRFEPENPAGGEKNTPRSFRHRVDRTWGVSSFSSLILGTSPEARDRDPLSGTENPAEPNADPTSIHAFPGGTGTGLCLHAIFETIDFTRPAEFETRVTQKLKDHALDPVLWAPAVTRTVMDTINVENPAGFSLASISRESRLSELEFHLPAARLNAASLRNLLGDIGDLEFAERQGWLKGFIDLICEHEGRYYVIDWKSNRLGASGADYTANAVASTMAEHHYFLQALLYLVALHRYLRSRMKGYQYGTHCGGALYYFVRGCDSRRPGSGIHAFNPGAETVEKLSAWLQGES